MALFEIKEAKVVEINGIKFNRFGIEDKPIFDEITHSLSYDETYWEQSFEYLFPFALDLSRKGTSELLWRKVKGYMMVFIHNKKKEFVSLLGSPFAKKEDRVNLQEAMELLIKILKKVNVGDKRSYVWGFVRPFYEEIISADFMKEQKLRVTAKEDMCDFIYKCSDLINLEGGKYKSKRKMVNRFKNKHPNHVIRFYTESDMDGIMAVRALWCKTRFKDKDSIWDYNIFNELMNFRKELGLRITVAEVEGVIVGFCIISKLADNCMTVLKECVDIKYEGLSEYLWYESLRLSIDLGEYENDGNATNGAGLFAYKTNHHPVMLLYKSNFFFNRKDTPVSTKIYKWNE